MKRKTLKVFAKLLSVVFILVTVVNGFVKTSNISAAGVTNTAENYSPDNIYYAEDKTHMLKIWTSDNKLAESWSFCLNEGKGTPSYDGKGYYVGTYHFKGSNTWALMQEVNKSYPRYNDGEKMYKVMEILMYMFHEDPYNIKSKNGISDYQYWVAMQEVVYYFAQNRNMANNSAFPGMNQAQNELKEKAEQYVNGQINFPDNSKFVELKVYEGASGGVQSLVTGRVRNKPKVFFSKQINKDGITDEEMKHNIYNFGGLSGANLKLTDEDGNVLKNLDTQSELKWTTNTAPQAVTLMPGNYRLIEDKAPEGYQRVDAVDFTVASDGRIITNGKLVDNDTIVLLDNKIEVTKKLISIKKVGNGNVMLNGANFELWKEGETTQKLDSWVSQAGSAKEIQLEEGSYRLKETLAPVGHKQIDKDIIFTVKSDGNIELKEQNGNVVSDKNELTIKNTKVPYIGTFATASMNKITEAKELNIVKNSSDKISVVDRIDYSGFSDGKYIAVATLIKNNEETNVISTVNKEFTVSNGKDVGSVSVDLQLENKHLELGTNKFTVLEKIYNASDITNGVVNNTAVPVAEHVVKDDANQTVTVKVSEPNFIFAFWKVNDKDEPIEGARLQILDKTGQQVPGMIWNSQRDNFTRITLKEGSYVLKEIETPDGYHTFVDKKFTVNANGEISFENTEGIKITKAQDDGYFVRVTNNKITTTEVTFSKTAINGTEELVGAKLKVVKGDKATGEEVTSWESSSTQHKFTLEEGTYTMVESQAPNGYEIAESITFKVTTEGKVQIKQSDGSFVEAPETKVQMKDAPSTTPSVEKTIEISKVKLGGEELEGAKIKISKKDGTEVISWVSGKTAKEIKLTAGEYVFHEEAAPIGYLKVTDINFEVDKEGKVTVKNANGNEVKAQGNKLTVTDKEINNPVGELKTTVTAGGKTSSEEKIAELSAKEVANKVVVVDKIKYSGLIPNEKYEVIGIIYEVKDGKLVNPDQPVAVNNGVGEYTADKTGNGEWELNFGEIKIDSGKSYVVYEMATSFKALIDKDSDGKPEEKHRVTHENPKDKSQTFTVLPEEPVGKEVTFSKTEINGTKELEGANLKVEKLKEDGSVEKEIASWKSETIAKKITLSEGQYVMTETQAPEGYEV
ncbi:MAG: SpaA isopeptide-forming pilin-related protein, partial [Peptoniphilaceae bacterium]|nr:SpaA isopeptide-forming pilin-related protein [Peptoniphilaceae bacterium]